MPRLPLANPAAPVTGADKSVLTQAGKVLESHGFNKTGAAGVLGNAYQESSWDPSSVGDGGGGLWGFTSGAISLPSLQSYAQQNGENWEDPTTQANFIAQHITPEQRQAVNTAGNPAAAATWFMNNWEHPAVATENQSRRESGANAAIQVLRGDGTAAPATTPHAQSLMHQLSGGAVMPQQTYKLQQVTTPLNIKAAAGNAFLRAAENPNNHDPLQGLMNNLESGNYGGVTKTVNQRLPVAQAVATAKMRIGTTTQPANNSQYQQIVNAATAVAAHQYNYEWGGGHNSSFAPTTGSGHGSGPGVGYDCSGVLSDIFHSVGLLNTPLVASQFADAGKYIKGAKPGPGGKDSITIYANSEHTFSKIGNQYFGTSASQNPGGGAGFFKDADTAGYQVWHVNL